MKIQFLGTSATERVPAMFCECEVCEKSRKAGGRNIRTRSQALIDDLILIDFPAETFMHFSMYNVPFRNIRHCLLTHSHMDHLYCDEVALKKRRFAYVYENTNPLIFYSEQSGYEMIENVRNKNGIPDTDFYAKKITPKESFDINGYEITPLKAVHDPKSTPVLYIIKNGDKSIFYSTDTSEYCDETMSYLENLEKPLDIIALDCTYGCDDTDCIGHMDFGRCTKLKKVLLDIGAADKNTIFVLTHFSHNGKNAVYDEFSEIAKKEGFVTAYDGMIVEV